MKRKLLSFLLLLALTACTAPTSPTGEGSLSVVVTTSILGDVAGQVGGSHVSIRILLPIGSDPHAYEPRPQDVAALSDADLVLINGLGLEETLLPLLENARAVIPVSDGIDALVFSGDHEGGEGGLDPHVWQDPNNVMVWTRNIAEAFANADPDHAADYNLNAQAYIDELSALDTWIREQVAQIPAQDRKLVTEHDTFGYFAARYGFELIGEIIPSVSTGSSPSAQELAALEDAIRTAEVKAVFVGSTVNPDLSRRVADDTGVRLVSLFTDSLSVPGGGAESYLEFMRYNVNAILEALK